MIAWLKGFILFLQMHLPDRDYSWEEIDECEVKEEDRAEMKQLMSQWEENRQRSLREDPEYVRDQQRRRKQMDAYIRIEDGWERVKGWFAGGKQV